VMICCVILSGVMLSDVMLSVAMCSTHVGFHKLQKKDFYKILAKISKHFFASCSHKWKGLN
jgi:hypothetical protein